MRILFVASELTPIAKVGGLGDVMGALPKALARLGTQVSIVIPRYEFIKPKTLACLPTQVQIPLAKKKERVSIYHTTPPKTAVKVFLLDNPTYLSRGPGPYFENTAFASQKKELQRFIFFSKAVAEFLRQGLFGQVDIVHCNDWHTGALVSLLKRNSQLLTSNLQIPKTIFTIHNLGNQGRWNAGEIDKWLLPKNEKSPFTRNGRNYNFMSEGIRNATQVTTVSPTYAKEVLTKKYGEGLEPLLNTRRKNLVGILNGIDYDFFNPAQDKFIFKTYSAKHSVLKSTNKSALQKSLKFTHNATVPLFGLVARLTHQKGIDFIIKALPRFLKNFNAQFIFLGRGAKKYEHTLNALARKFSNKIYTKIGFNEQLAHRIYAGSDFFLMPSRFEPSGLGQMISMRYGTIPIVRETGGLKDSVKHLKTGFIFKKESSAAFYGAIDLARRYYIGKPGKIAQLKQNCFKENFDFSRAAKEYLKLYRRVSA